MPHSGDVHCLGSKAYQVGSIVKWIDKKGYGWVVCDGQQFFAHIKDFESGKRRPRLGDEVHFIRGLDPKGRPFARQISISKAGSMPIGIGPCAFLCLLLFLPMCTSTKLPLDWWYIPSHLLILSAISYAMYAHDKMQAISKGWRVAESSLHLAEMLGGWPGAYIAQRKLRHKCSKIRYQIVFWLIIAIHQLAALDLLLDHHITFMLLDFE